jgi:hypothetical protein
VAEVVANPLAKFFHRCLEISYCPKHFRESITSAIRKERKPDYHSVGAYRSIALLNTIGKLLERIVADRLADMLEIQRMLPEFQICRNETKKIGCLGVATPDGSNTDNMGTGKEESGSSAMSRYVAGAYDHVSYPRLLHVDRGEKNMPGMDGLIDFIPNRKDDKAESERMQVQSHPDWNSARKRSLPSCT